MKIFYTLLLSVLSHLAFGQAQYLERPKFLLELSGIASKDFTVQTSEGKTSKSFGRGDASWSGSANLQYFLDKRFGAYLGYRYKEFWLPHEIGGSAASTWVEYAHIFPIGLQYRMDVFRKSSIRCFLGTAYQKMGTSPTVPSARNSVSVISDGTVFYRNEETYTGINQVAQSWALEGGVGFTQPIGKRFQFSFNYGYSFSKGSFGEKHIRSTQLATGKVVEAISVSKAHYRYVTLGMQYVFLRGE